MVASVLDELEPPKRFRIRVANKKELAGDLVLKARQIDCLIQSLPPPEPEERQAGAFFRPLTHSLQSHRLGDYKPWRTK